MTQSGQSAKTAVHPKDLEEQSGTFYPDKIKGASELRRKRRLGDAVGITKFGVNYTILPPGASSALRHWHEREDEFIYILEGTVTLVTNDGAQELDPGMAAGFPAGQDNGHHLMNNGTGDAVFLEIGNREETDKVHYPDDDLFLSKEPGNQQYFDKAGNSLGARVEDAPGSNK